MEQINTAGRILPTEQRQDLVPSDIVYELLSEKLRKKVEKLREEGCKPNHSHLQVFYFYFLQSFNFNLNHSACKELANVRHVTSVMN